MPYGRGMPDDRVPGFSEPAKQQEHAGHSTSEEGPIPAPPEVRELRERLQRSLAASRKTQIEGTSEPVDPIPGVESSQKRTKRGRTKSAAPAGKVKASFNLLPEDIDSLRAMAERLGTTVTSVLQRAIRDERFVQEQLTEGNRFAVVDRQGTVREIIWR